MNHAHKWHYREPSPIAAPIIIYESDNPIISSLADELAFENAITLSRAKEQTRLEREYAKPSALPVESTPFPHAESLESWLASQPKNAIEEFEAV